MQADEIRAIYGYHFTLNRRLWDESIILLSDEKYLRPLEYSVGSIRNQIVHMVSVDEGWFHGFAGNADRLPMLNPVNFPSRETIRKYWDGVEVKMRAVLDALTDDMVNTPREMHTRYGQVMIPTWQLLLHVANHGTDHRAQTLAMLHTIDAPTFAQDMVFYFGTLPTEPGVEATAPDSTQQKPEVS